MAGRLRAHTITQSDGDLSLVPATEPPIAASQFNDDVDQEWRYIRANGVSEHDTGAFPNRGNPDSIREQSYAYRVPATPELSGAPTPAGLQAFGVAVNGVPFDPGAAEFYRGDPRSGWQYEPLSGAISLGLDESHAHVQPTGAYHYHGLPTLLLERLGADGDAHSPLVGWAADGFPIYALHGFADADDPSAPIVELRSSYRLKSGQRPSGPGEPGGVYDGTFVADYVFIPEAGDLDACNGRVAVTPEFPDGAYAYFLTRDWPVIPRCFVGTPSADFARGPQRQDRQRQRPRGQRR